MVGERLRSLPPSIPSVSASKLSRGSTCVSILKHEMFKPEGLMALLHKRVKPLEERWANKAIEHGNCIFKDQLVVKAFVIMAGDNDLYRYCVDFLSLLNLSPDPFFTVSEGMASEVAAVKTNFNSLLEARIALLYQITYPDNLMRRNKKTGVAVTDGWSWTSTCSSFEHFKGSFINGDP